MYTSYRARGRKFSFVVLLFLLVPHHIPAHAEGDYKFLIGGVLACAGGILWAARKMVKSYTYCQAAQRMIHAQQTTKTIEHEYSGLVLMIPNNHETRHHLEAVADNLPQHQSMHHLIKQLAKNIDELKIEQAFLKTKLTAWCHDTYYKALIAELQNTKKALDQQLASLEKLEDFLSKHEVYFRLAMTCIHIAQEYDNELKALNDSTVSVENALKKISTIIHTKYFSPRTSFPLVTYGEHLEPDLRALQEDLHNIPQEQLYEHRHQEAQRILERLRVVKEYIAEHPAYQQQRLAFAHLQQQEQSVQAQQRTVEELARKNDIEEQRLREERNKNALLMQHITTTERNTQECARLRDSLYRINNLILEHKQLINTILQDTQELKATYTLVAGYNPQSYEYNDCLHQARLREQKLANLSQELDTLQRRLKQLP